MQTRQTTGVCVIATVPLSFANAHSSAPRDTGREESAREAFTTALTETDLGRSERVTVQLLRPSSHLTAASWTDFNRWVKTHEGCSAKRREATEAEKAAHKETRKGKVYWVDVVITRAAQDAVCTGQARKRPAQGGAADKAPKKQKQKKSSKASENVGPQGAVVVD